MKDAGVREALARIAARPSHEWGARLEHEFPSDPAMRTQALLWLHADRARPLLEGATPSLGEAADERYELMLRLDTGATASVWQAFDRKLGRQVAIKVFHEPADSEALDQVLAEARAASDVISDHVVRVLDVHHGDGRPYIVMELVGEYDPDKGDVVLGMGAASSEPRSIDEVARWVMHAARGVHEAHLRNVFHRDLKPNNVLITPISRRARVADFGLAVSAASSDLAHPAMALLRRGPSGPVSVRGTPEYMAPEQARGLPLSLDPRVVTDRSVLVAIDVWGLGAIAYQLLTGRPPWLARPGEDYSAWEVAAASTHPPRLDRTRDGERIPPRLRRVIEKAMASDPAARYATAGAVANDMRAVLQRRPTTLDLSRVLRITLWGQRNPPLAMAVAVTLGLSALTAATHTTVTRLRAEREALTDKVDEQKAERARLKQRVDQARAELDATRQKLATHRERLTKLETELAEERTSYQSVLEVKERALRDATSNTRQ
ncbi:MAG: protein kinase, partial [Kofleriaceae bacterium]